MKNKNIEKLIDGILNVSLKSESDDYYGAYLYECPFCGNHIFVSDLKDGIDVIDQIKHDNNCSYKLAKQIKDTLNK